LEQNTVNDELKINVDGGCDITLYSFAYYQKALCDYYINSYKMYNYYYLFGSNKIEEDKNRFVNENKSLIERVKNTEQTLMI